MVSLSLRNPDRMSQTTDSKDKINNSTDRLKSRLHTESAKEETSQMNSPRATKRRKRQKTRWARCIQEEL